MRRFGQLSIRGKLGLLAALAAGSALFLACMIFVANDAVTVRRFTVQHLSAVADVLGANTVAALTFHQQEPAREVLGSLRHEPIVECACVYDRDGKVFATYQRDGLPQPLPLPDSVNSSLSSEGCVFSEDGRLQVTTEIRDTDGRVGWLILQASMEHLHDQMLRHVAVAAVVLTVSLLASYIVSSVLQKRIAGPITELAGTADRISQERDYSVRVEYQSTDEIGTLYAAFNRMLDEIQMGEAQLRRAHDELEQRVIERTQQLTTANQELGREVAERKRAEEELRALQEQHIESARRAGMAEIATSVLHNVGNVLNSVNISAGVITDKVARLGIADLQRAVAMMQEHSDDLGEFVTRDERGRHVLPFLTALGDQMRSVTEQIDTETRSLVKNIEHIKDIVALQQSYAGASGMVEIVSVSDLLDDAIRINLASIRRHGVEVVRGYDDLPSVALDKQKFLQIVINLVSNAKYSVMHGRPENGRIDVRLTRHEHNRIRVEVIDNGQGIPPENLTRIFSHGFTTKRNGHGFGLHGSALYAKEMGGSLRASSAGVGCGATFTLELPLIAGKQN